VFSPAPAKDQQLSESATGENNRFANLSERDLEKILEDELLMKTKKNTNWCVSTFKGEFQNLKSYFLNRIQIKQMKCCNLT